MNSNLLARKKYLKVIGGEVSVVDAAETPIERSKTDKKMNLRK
jgi:uncharacterized protein involved in exopolysaccharide biosynthesis